MKPSGIEWIGDIPESWNVQPMKYMVFFCNGDRGDNYPSKSEMTNEGVPFINAGHLTDNGLDFDNMDYISENKYKCMSGVKLQKDDILYCLRGSVGKNTIISIEKGTVASSLVAIRTHNMHSKYLFYCLNSDVENVQRNLFDNGTAQPNLSADNLGKYKIAIPGHYEQTLIANFLDKQCGKIDSIIADLEKQIEILGQYKKSLITETVTKGLDKNAPMKDSGIEWIGKIPEHWEVKRIKYFLSVSSGDAIANEELEEGDIPVYGGGKQMGYYNKSNVPNNTVLIGRVGANCGCVTIISEKSWATDNALIVNTKYNRKYIYYLLESANLNKLNDANAQPLITGAKVGNYASPIVLNIDEQNQIANFLDNQCSKIDSIIQSKQEQLTKITEYKKALIYEYVTGKKRVKGAVTNGN